MCGRFLLRTPAQEAARIFRTTGVTPAFQPRFNLAPTAAMLCVRFNPADRLRHLGLLHWGLIPLSAQERAIGNKLINARSETITEKPAFKEASTTSRRASRARGERRGLWRHRGLYAHDLARRPRRSTRRARTR